MLTDDPIITKVLPRWKYEPKRNPVIPQKPRVDLGKELNDVETPKQPINIFGKIKLGVLLTPIVFKIITGLAMKNWKTTVTGIVGAIAILVNAFTGVHIPEAPIAALAIFLIGLFAGDANETK